MNKKETSNYKNVLPSNFPSWHYLLEKVHECYTAGDIPENFYLDVTEKTSNETVSYNFDIDFIKARAYEELNTLIEPLIKARSKDHGDESLDALKDFTFKFEALTKSH